MSVVADSAFDHPLVIAARLRLQSSDPRRGQLMLALDRPELGYRFPMTRLPEFARSAEVEAYGLARVFSDEEQSEFIYVFTRPVEECLAALALGRREFRAAAEAAVGQALPEILLEELFCAVLQAFHHRLSKPEILPL